MASFDIELLFTNIPLQETIDLWIENLFEHRTHADNLSKDTFLELLLRTMSESLILFSKEFYKQHGRVAIGSPIGPTLTNVFVYYHEKIWLQNCPSKFKPVIYRKYVDDTFLLFCLKHHIEKFRNYFSRQHKNIRFTSETENENSMSLLDIKISRDSNKFTTSVYRKLTFSRVFTNFGSFIPKSYEYNLLFTLLHRTFQTLLKFWIFSSGNWQTKSYFWKNGHPKVLLISVLKGTLIKLLLKKKY